MAFVRDVISTLNNDGTDIMGPSILGFHHPNTKIVDGSLLTVESNHFAILKGRGAIISAHETGQYPLTTPDKIIFGSIVQGFFGNQNPWQYEVIYLNRSKLRVQTTGMATTAEMAEISYVVDFYIHIDTKEDALKLVTHMPFNGHFITTKEVSDYAGPVIEQAVNSIAQVNRLEMMNEHAGEISEQVKTHLLEFLAVYGIHLNDVKVLITPRDERMRELISLRAFGLEPVEAVRYYTALKMAEKGLVSAPNAACGQPFNIGTPALATTPVGSVVNLHSPEKS